MTECSKVFPKQLGGMRLQGCTGNPGLEHLVTSRIFHRVFEQGFQSDELSMEEEEKLGLNKPSDAPVYVVDQPAWQSQRVSFLPFIQLKDTDYYDEVHPFQACHRRCCR